MTRIDRYALRRIDCPLGRMIGDNSCAYDAVVITELMLWTSDGHRASGFAHAAPAAVHRRPAWWFHPLPTLAQFRATFEVSWWPRLQRAPVDDKLAEIRHGVVSGDFDLDRAVRLAIWDLEGQVAALPLHAMLGGANDRKAAYGSALEFPLDDSAAEAELAKLVASGVRQLKLKVGADDVAQDIARLRLARSLAGPGVALAADANEAWDAATTLDRLEQFDAAGVGLAYIEDPINHRKTDEIAALTRRCPVPVAGNDYVTSADAIRQMLDAGIGIIRCNNDIDYMLDCVELSREYGVPIAIGNSPFETSAQVAAAFDEVAIIEFADLGWNALVTDPARLVDGELVVAPGPGHGVVLREVVA